MKGQVDFKDFLFAKEVKFNQYRNKPPSQLICERRKALDPANIPLMKERIQYVVVMN